MDNNPRNSPDSAMMVAAGLCTSAAGRLTIQAHRVPDMGDLADRSGRISKAVSEMACAVKMLCEGLCFLMRNGPVMDRIQELMQKLDAGGRLTDVETAELEAIVAEATEGMQ